MNTQDTQHALAITDLSVMLSKSKILQAISLELAQGEIGCLLGPSGCGKTTLLRTIAGFITPQTGKIHISNQLASSVKHVLPVEKRAVGMVFQDFALFPHLNVFDNIAFGLKNLPKTNRLNNAEISERVQELLALIELSDKAERFPHELSGGQQQRIALARALAPKPSIILLDEPFSSIDRSMRDTLAYKVREILKKENATTVMVTHDQAEAYAMADKVGIMQSGQLLQWDTPMQIYHQPTNKFVASFIGESHFISAKKNDAHTLECAFGQLTDSTERKTTGNVQLLVRPDDIILDDTSSIRAKVLHQFFKGASFMYLLELASGENVYALLANNKHILTHSLVGQTIGIKRVAKPLVYFE